MVVVKIYKKERPTRHKETLSAGGGKREKDVRLMPIYCETGVSGWVNALVDARCLLEEASRQTPLSPPFDI